MSVVLVPFQTQQNVGTFLAFLYSSNWNEWYVSKRWSKGPGVEFKVHGHWSHEFHVDSTGTEECNFPKHISRPAFTCTSNASLQITVGHQTIVR